jgi:DNA-directed RNA polymerase specialized sigma24 family protein
LTWLRSVLAQRHVDAIRSARRLDPLPEEDRLPPASARPDPDAERYQRLMQDALEAAIAGLDPRDRLRLACYHAQQLTLAETGRLLHEHEATVSRRLAQTRRALRPAIEAWLERQGGLRPAEVQRCLQLTLADPGELDLAPILARADARKIRDDDRSKRGVS